MKIQQRRKVQIESSHEDLCAQVNAWAAKYGFVLDTLTDNQMVFTRGNSWRAIYSFDLRKLPTKVSITLSGESPIEVDCAYTVESLLSISTPDDADKVTEQLDLLIGCLSAEAR